MTGESEYRLLVAGGKTGGHLFPGIAVARRFMALGPNYKALFVGTREGIEARVLPKEGIPLRFVRSSGIRGAGILGMVKGLLLIPVTIFQATVAVLSYKPNVVLGVGGFVSGPVLVAAWLLRKRTAIQEQNAMPGWTNRILGRLVNVIFVAFEESAKYFPAKKVMVVGNPVREELMTPSEGESELHVEMFNPEFRTLFVFGGSQGARPINRAVADFLRSNPTIRDRLNLIHQTGNADLEEMQNAYSDMGYKAVVVPFIHRMDEAYGAADLVVARAGAGTVFELMALGKPSILVPFPQAAGDHQTFNALALAEKGAAVMVKQSDMQNSALGRAIKDLLINPMRLKELGEKARSMGRIEAARVIAGKLNEMAMKN